MTDSTMTYVLYGWQASYYTGKVRSYLRRKGIAFREEPPTLLGYYFGLRRRTGVVAIPVLRTPEGEWLQDSSVIIDTLEARHPEPAVLPQSPVPRFAAYLFELWTDECWIPTGLHTRWNHLPENWPFLEGDVAGDLLPGWPRMLQRRAAMKVASHMSNYLPKAGVVPAQHALLDRWAELQLDALEAHFAVQPFLFGGRPSLGDFGLMGPLFGHLSRDPWPAQRLIAPRPHVAAWIARMNQPEPSRDGAFQVGETLAPTLAPLVGSLLGELVPYLEATRRVAAPAMQRGGVLPRFMDEVAFPMADGVFRRPAMPYALWMLQRLLDVWRAMPTEDRTAVRQWLDSHGAARLLDLDLPRLKRVGLRAAPDASTTSATDFQRAPA